MKLTSRGFFKSKSGGVTLIVLAAVLIELTSATMYWYGSRGIRREVKHRAETELRVKSLEIGKVMTAVESAVKNSVWAVEEELQRPDSLTVCLRRLVRLNSSIVGAGIIFEADYYAQKGRWFEPYVAMRPGGEMEENQIGGPDHDYLKATWFHEAMAADKGYWSEPYYDGEGAKMMLCSYFAPIHDSKGRTVAVIGADVSLEWLSAIINERQIYPSSYNIMISRTGQLMVCPVESLVLKRNIEEVTARLEDTTANYVNHQMMAGHSGQADIIDEHGEKNYIFYAPVEGETGWSMAVVCSDRDIFYGLRQVGFNLLLMMVVGLLLMSYIVWSIIKNTRELQTAEQSKAVMAKELHIATSIQKSLLPKENALGQGRPDMDIATLLRPAREVGGDLYDYYVRDEKLFFCIGDVSGKGVPAALVMAVTRTLFRNVSAHEAKPRRILAAINETLAADNPDDFFVTLFVGVLDLPTGRLYYANAGHELPLMLNDGKKVTLEGEANVPVGAVPGWNFVQQELLLPDVATLFLYTDGLTEAMNAAEELYGKERMMETLCERSPHDIIGSMKASVDEFVGEAVQSDDLTMLVVSYERQKRQDVLSESIILPNEVNTVPKLNSFVESVCGKLGLDPSQSMKICLAVEEAVVNVMNYAYPSDSHGKVQIDAQASSEWLKFVITDSGTPFDPTAHAEADTSLSVEERPIGGLGIYLVRHYMDSVNYERIDGKNVLTLRCKI